MTLVKKSNVYDFCEVLFSTNDNNETDLDSWWTTTRVLKNLGVFASFVDVGRLRKIETSEIRALLDRGQPVASNDDDHTTSLISDDDLIRVHRTLDYLTVRGALTLLTVDIAQERDRNFDCAIDTVDGERR